MQLRCKKERDNLAAENAVGEMQYFLCMRSKNRFLLCKKERISLAAENSVGGNAIFPLKARQKRFLRCQGYSNAGELGHSSAWELRNAIFPLFKNQTKISAA